MLDLFHWLLTLLALALAAWALLRCRLTRADVLNPVREVMQEWSREPPSDDDPPVVPFKPRGK